MVDWSQQLFSLFVSTTQLTNLTWSLLSFSVFPHRHPVITFDSTLASWVWTFTVYETYNEELVDAVLIRRFLATYEKHHGLRNTFPWQPRGDVVVPRPDERPNI